MVPLQSSIRIALGLGVFVLSSCAPKDDVKKSEAEVDTVHQHWNEGEFATVYNDAHIDFRTAQSSQKTLWQLQHNRRFYGAFKSATQRSANMSSANSVKDITLTYGCVYENGNASESFTFRMTDGKTLLTKYTMTPERANMSR
jgi:hypothetical protein